MQTIDEVREHCRFVGKGIENLAFERRTKMKKVTFIVAAGCAIISFPRTLTVILNGTGRTFTSIHSTYDQNSKQTLMVS